MLSEKNIYYTNKHHKKTEVPMLTLEKMGIRIINFTRDRYFT